MTYAEEIRQRAQERKAKLDAEKKCALFTLLKRKIERESWLGIESFVIGTHSFPSNDFTDITPIHTAAGVKVRVSFQDIVALEPEIRKLGFNIEHREDTDFGPWLVLI